MPLRTNHFKLPFERLPMLGLDLTFQLILKLLLEIPVVASARYFLFDNNPLSARYLLFGFSISFFVDSVKDKK